MSLRDSRARILPSNTMGEMNASLARPRILATDVDHIAAPAAAPRLYQRAWRNGVVLGDIAALGVSFGAAVVLLWRFTHMRPSLGACAVAGMLILVAFAAHGLHERSYAVLRRDEFYYAMAVTLIAGIVIVPAFFALDLSWPSRLAVAVGVLFAGVLIGAVRYIIRRSLGDGHLFVAPRSIVVGSNGEAHATAAWIERDPRARASVVAPPREEDAERWLSALYCDAAPTHIVIAESISGIRLSELTRAAARRGIVLAIAGEGYAHVPSVRGFVLGSSTLVELGLPRAGSPWACAAKRLFDIVVATLALLIAAPVLALATLGILLEDGAPVLYTQPRVGRDGSIFHIFKLRSMRVDAETRTGPVWAVHGDARVTRVGRFLRRSSIDELPQLVNVLRGEMSIVGPRPERPLFVQRFSEAHPEYQERLAVPPGLTACSHLYMSRNIASDAVAERLDYDLFYIRHWSLAMDIALLLKTAAEVVFHRAA